MTVRTHHAYERLQAPQRRGACPGLSAPMPTGDGLVVRLTPSGTMPLGAFAALCAAAQRHGNGVIEVTARGSVQVRGLSAASAPRFAADIAELGIAAADGVPVLCGPLAGLDAEEIIDAGALAAEIRDAAAQSALASELNPKVSVLIDGGGRCRLDAIAADVRLEAVVLDDSALRVSVAGDAASATGLGFISPSASAAVVTSLLEVIAQRRDRVRARDIVATEGVAPFRAAMASRSLRSFPRKRESGTGSPLSQGRAERQQTIGAHPLRDGAFAYGIGLAFGHADAVSLQTLSEAAASFKASGVRTAPDRTLLIVGVAQQKLPALVSTAAALGLVVRADDPRRRVIACAGAPICASGHIAARAIAPDVAALVAAHCDRALTVHISGCAKSCAHPGAAALTVVGSATGCRLVTDGTARDAPSTVASADSLLGEIAAHLRRHKSGAGHV